MPWFRAAVSRLAPFLLAPVLLWAQNGAIPPLVPLEVRSRVGVFGQTTISLPEVIQRVLANDRELEVARISIQEAGFNVRGAQGYYDPRLGLTAYRLRRVSPVSSLLGGAANGKLTFKELNADPEVSGLSPWLGGSYRADFNSSRQLSDSQFLTLNPQFPSSANLNLTQPLWRGLRFDENRHRLQVARKNQKLTAEQFRQRVIEIVTQAIQAYWDLDFARRNLDVQIEAVRLAERQDQSNRRQVEQGLLAPVDVIAAQTQVATFQQNVFTAQETLTRAENNVKTLMLPDRNDLLWGTALLPETQTDPGGATPTLAEAIERALKDRPELAQSGIAIEVNQLDARLSRELAKPQIDAVAALSSAGLAGRAVPLAPNPFADLIPGFGSNQIPPIFVGGYGQSLNNITNGYFPTVQLGVQVSIPLRNRTAQAQSAISAAEGRRLRTLRSQTEMLIESDVRNSLQSVESARARLDAAALARRFAEDQYSSEQRQFQAGTSTVFLVLQRQTDLITARTREVRAKADFGKAAADLDRATARTLEVRNIRLSQ